jgi:hypothetical protein
MNAMLSAFYAHGRLDVLAVIRDGVMHPMVAFDLYRRQGITAFPDAANLEPLTVLAGGSAGRVAGVPQGGPGPDVQRDPCRVSGATQGERAGGLMA